MTKSSKDTWRQEMRRAERERLELAFLRQLRGMQITGWESQYRFHEARRWRFDFAFPASMVALEIDGGIWSGGRHTRGLGFSKDVEKLNEATLLGWRVLRATGDHVMSGKALQWVERALGDS